MIRRFDSIAALREIYLTRSAPFKPSGNLDWFNNETNETTLRLSELGDTSLVPEAEKVLNSLETSIETPRPSWLRSPAGAFCVVPDVLAGLPTPMRRQVHTFDEHNPITIIVDTASSGGISADMFKRRGIAVLALVLALSRVRPVSLQIMNSGFGIHDQSGETILTAEINTAPLDLATACYVLTSVGFTRRLFYGVEEVLNGFNGDWPKGYILSETTNYYDNLKSRLVADPSRCLIINAPVAGDQLLSNPVAWLNEKIRHFTQLEEEI